MYATNRFYVEALEKIDKKYNARIKLRKWINTR